LIEKIALPAGVEPGLRFALVLDGRGGCRDLDWRGVAGWRPEDGFLWVHLERDTDEAAAWIHGPSGIDPLVGEALLAEGTRPRIELVDEAMLIVLRGINRAEVEEAELMPIHIWMDAGRAVTLRDRDHKLVALRDIRLMLVAGRGPKIGGALLVQIADKVIRDVEPVIDEMDDDLERLEDHLNDKDSPGLRRELAEIRRDAIHLRRYLGPQREVMVQLQAEPTPLLDRVSRLRLRGVTDRVARACEDLDAVRDRATILYQDLTAQIQEAIARTSYRFTVVAAVLLPPSLVAGILGVNIGGIPGSDDPGAFYELITILGVLLLIQFIVLKWMKWL
jgi:zinc transporter